MLGAQTAGKGFEALEAKDFSGAITAFEKALLVNANDVASLIGIARTLNTKGWNGFDPEKAIEYIEQAEAKMPNVEAKEMKQLEKLNLDKAAVVSLRNGIERNIFNKINEKDEEAYQAFIKRFPKSVVYSFAFKAASKLGAEKARTANTIEAYTVFVDRYAGADEFAEIQLKRDEMALNEAKKSLTSDALKEFLKKYPDSPVKKEAEQSLHQTAFEEAKTLNTSDAMVEYIDEYPNSVFIELAQKTAKTLRAEGK